MDTFQPIDVLGNERKDLEVGSQPLNVLTQVALQKQAEARAQQRNIQNMTMENQFVTARNAAQIATEAQNRREEETQREAGASRLSAQESAQRISQAASDADINRDNQIYAKAQLYKLPIHDDDGNKIPADELNEDIGDAAGKQAAAIHAQIAANNSKLAGLTVPLPDIQAAAQSAARNVVADPSIAAQVTPDTIAKVQALVAAQRTNPLGLANLIYGQQHGIGSTVESWLPGQSGKAQAKIIQDALSAEMDKQIAAQTNVKSQQAMFLMRGVAQQNEVLQNKYEQYFQDASPDAQLKLLSPSAVTNAATGGASSASTSDPADEAADGASGVSGTSTMPPLVGAVPPSAITQHYQSMAQADDAMGRAQQLAQRLSDLTDQKQSVHQMTSPGAQVPQEGSPQLTYRPLSAAEQAQSSQQEDAIDAQIASTQRRLGSALKTVKNLKAQALGVPPATPPASVPQVAPAGQPAAQPAIAANTPQGQALQAMMRQLAAQDGVSPQQMQQGVQAAQAGNPKAIASIRQYYQRASSAIAAQNNPFAASQNQQQPAASDNTGYSLPPVGQPVVQ